MQEAADKYMKPVIDFLNYNFFTLGNAQITPLSLIYLLLASVILVYASRKLKDLILDRVLSGTRLDIGAKEAIGTITRYIILFLGFLIIIQSVGIDLTSLTVLAGAVGIGIGFGLQNIANNFISGLIILLERPIKAGDRIEVGNVNGKVVTIGARSTRIRTNDNITIIVPNSKFISDNVINWSFENATVRFRIPVRVAYDSDIDLVSKVLIETAKANEDVAETPTPSVRLTDFEESSIRFELRAWSTAKLHRPTYLRSSLNFAILKAFGENGIEMPFPQRDVRLLRHDKSTGSAD